MANDKLHFLQGNIYTESSPWCTIHIDDNLVRIRNNIKTGVAATVFQVEPDITGIIVDHYALGRELCTKQAKQE